MMYHAPVAPSATESSISEKQGAVMAGKAIEITPENFAEMVLKADVPVLVDFWAEWCMPCKAIGPTVEQIAEEYDGRARVGKMNIDAAREIALQYDIRAIPSLFVFKNGEVVDKIVGAVSKSHLTKALDAAL